MPTRPAKDCRRNGCPNKTAAGYCDPCRFNRKPKAEKSSSRKGSAHSRGYGVAWRKRRDLVLARDPYCMCSGCPTCNRAVGCYRPSNECDHVVPKSLGGGDTLENLQGLCDRCHAEKSKREAGGALHAGPATIVAGPPASGKTTYVQMHRKPGDVVYDFDTVAEALLADSAYDPEAREFVAPMVAAARVALLRAWAKQPRNRRHLWVIVGAPSASHRERLASQLRAGVVVLEVPGVECLARIENDARADSAGRAAAVERWWDEYQPRQGDAVERSATTPARVAG